MERINEVGKLPLKLKIYLNGKPRSWKDLKSDVGRFLFKMERAKQSWTEPSEVGNNRAKLKIFSKVRMFR